MATGQLTGPRTQSFQRRSKDAHFRRSKSDASPRVPERSRPAYERSKSTFIGFPTRRRHLRRASRSETITPLPPLNWLEKEQDVQHKSQWEEEEQEWEDVPGELELRASSPTYSKSPYPSQPEHVLLPTPDASELITTNLGDHSYFTECIKAADALIEESYAGLFAEVEEDIKRQSSSTIRSVTDPDAGPAAILPALSRLSQPTQNSVPRSIPRSVQPSEGYRTISQTSLRSSASSETFTTRDHDSRRSTCSNWTLWPPYANSTRPSSIQTRTPSPFGLHSPRGSLFGPRSLSHKRGTGSSSGHYFDSEPDSYPTSPWELNEDPLSYEIGNYPIDDTSLQNLDERPTSAGSDTSIEGEAPPPIAVPKRSYRPTEHPPCQPWSAPLPTISARSEPSSSDASWPGRMPIIPSSEYQPSVQGSQNSPHGSSESLHEVTSAVSISHSSGRTDTPENEPPENLTAPLARPLPLWIRNPWQSVDSMSFFGPGAVEGESRRQSESVLRSTSARPESRESNASTVIHDFSKTIPGWARSFYASGECANLSIADSNSTPNSSRPHTKESRNASNQLSPGQSRPNTNNTAPTASPRSSNFSIASIHRPRNRRRADSSVYSDSTYSRSVRYPSGNSNYISYADSLPEITLAMSQIPTANDSSYLRDIGGAGHNHENDEGPRPESAWQEGMDAGIQRGTPDRGLPSPRLLREQWSARLFSARRPSSVAGAGSRGTEWQIWLFALGFVVPLLWILAALSPIPSAPSKDTCEKDGGLDIDVEMGARARAEEMEANHARAKWWRKVNRCMSVVSVIIVAVVVALAIAVTH